MHACVSLSLSLPLSLSPSLSLPRSLSLPPLSIPLSLSPSLPPSLSGVVRTIQNEPVTNSMVNQCGLAVRR